MSSTVSRAHASLFSPQGVRNLLRGLSLLGLLIVFTMFGGAVGLIGGILIAILAFIVSNAYGFAIGQLGLLAIFPSPTLIEFLLAQCSLVPLLAAPLLRSEESLRGLFAVSLCYIGLATLVAMGLLVSERLWLIALALVVVLAGISYGIHRYEMLELGLLEEDL